MIEGRELTAVLDGRLDDRLVDEVVEAATDALQGDEIRDAVMRVVEISERDSDGARGALWALRGDAEALERLELCLGLDPRRATLALGGAIQLASSELASVEPDLRGRMPEMMRWLEGAW